MTEHDYGSTRLTIASCVVSIALLILLHTL